MRDMYKPYILILEVVADHIFFSKDARTREILQRKLLVVPPTSHRVYTIRPNDPRDLLLPADIKEGILKIVLTNKANRKGHHHIIKRTNTSMTMDSNNEVLEEIVSSVNHALSQIAHISASFEDRLSNVESQWVTTQKRFDILIKLLEQNGSSNGQLNVSQK